MTRAIAIGFQVLRNTDPAAESFVARVQMTTNLLDAAATWSNVYEVIGDGTTRAFTNTLSGAHQAFHRMVLDIPQ